MTDTEKFLLFGLVGLIAWELWPKQPAVQQSGFMPGDQLLSNVPPWIRQLSKQEQMDCFTDQDDTLQCLLSIPQGPAGTSSYPNGLQPIDFFNPTRGILGMCSQQRPRSSTYTPYHQMSETGEIINPDSPLHSAYWGV